ncbi:uncharacterized protein N7483_007640 [Penicillium malachiteum]|uniref:uncharacterized protein n=1 Tax=Penicillium malachiteum TaxID=1324776 RepID=UPI0025488D26|nr:uncharacterized protein N7483_007640 [Penicillium malachiteum]KAJ5726283.1 hypothetical protein N7483_007640 [Penicillium malachiteum]
MWFSYVFTFYFLLLSIFPFLSIILFLFFALAFSPLSHFSFVQNTPLHLEFLRAWVYLTGWRGSQLGFDSQSCVIQIGYRKLITSLVAIPIGFCEMSQSRERSVTIKTEPGTQPAAPLRYSAARSQPSRSSKPAIKVDTGTKNGRRAASTSEPPAKRSRTSSSTTSTSTASPSSGNIPPKLSFIPEVICPANAFYSVDIINHAEFFRPIELKRPAELFDAIEFIGPTNVFSAVKLHIPLATTVINWFINAVNSFNPIEHINMVSDVIDLIYSLDPISITSSEHRCFS